MRRLVFLMLIGSSVGCQCLQPVDEGRDAGLDAGADSGVDAGVRCEFRTELTPEVRHDYDSSSLRPGPEAFAWISKPQRRACVVYGVEFGLHTPSANPIGWYGIARTFVCNACDAPVVIETTHYGALTDRDNALGYVGSFSPEPTFGYSGADLGFGLRDGAGLTVPSSCVSDQDVWCFGHAGITGDAGAPTLHARRTELLPGESLGMTGFVHAGVSQQDVEQGKDLVVPTMPFEDWRGYLFGSSAPAQRLDLNGRLDLVAFLPRAVRKSELSELRPSKPRDQACAKYGFPLIGSYCRDRLDAGSYRDSDLVELVIPNVQLPDFVLDELRRRAARGGADGGPDGG